MGVFKRIPNEQQLRALIPQAMQRFEVEDFKVDPEKGTISCSFLVNDENVQPHGILHGGVSCVVAETLGSIAANLCLEKGQVAVGQSLHASHIKSAPKGLRVHAISNPTHIGRRSQIWLTNLYATDSEKLICTVSLTVAVIDQPGA